MGLLSFTNVYLVLLAADFDKTKQNKNETKQKLYHNTGHHQD